MDAYLSKVDQKVDLLLEKVNGNVRDGPSIGSHPVDADTTATNPLFESPDNTALHRTRGRVPTWGERAGDAARGARDLAGTRRFQIAAAAVCVGVLVLLAVVLVLALSWSAPPTFLIASAVPVATPASSAGPGSVMIDVQLSLDRAAQVLLLPVRPDTLMLGHSAKPLHTYTLDAASIFQVHYVLIPAADVEQEGSPPLTTFDVYTASLQTAESQLTEDAHACGLISVPAARENFTLTLAPSADTAECREYAEVSGHALDAWAATHRCSRCPVLESETRYKVPYTFLAPEHACNCSALICRFPFLL